jgi:DNA-binding IclR family transcriptional regulator
MFWQKNEVAFQEIDQVIQQNPGIYPAEIAKRLQVARSTVIRRLPSMEEAGYRYYEDEQGRLWPFTR